MQQAQQVRPISTYDNLGANASTSVQQQQQHPMSNIIFSAGESAKQLKVQPQASLFSSSSSSPSDSETLTRAMTENDNEDDDDKQDQELAKLQRNADSHGGNNNNSQHSIAAVKAALNDAKSKFFGINNYESVAIAPTTMQNPKPEEPKYQNVPQRNNNAVNQIQKPNQNDHSMEFTNYSRDPQPGLAISQSDLSSTTTAAAAAAAPPPPTTTTTPAETKTWRYATTYEQIPLSDLDAPQPSQAVYMSTTVPQNMKGIKIAGRHTPTRNSLRHSRMIVVNHKNNDTLQEAYSTHIRNLNLSRQLLILQLAVALLIVGLAIWILILAPNASILINPYLSGLSLLLASIAGLILLRRDHRPEQRPTNNCYKVLLAESYVFSALALIFCCLALVCAAIEFAALASAVNGSCGSATSSLLSYRNCTCLPQEGQTMDEEAPSQLVETTTTIAIATGQERSHSIESSENCGVFRNEWKYLLAFSMALNSLGIIATFLYITIFICCHRNRKQFYTSV
ncbi:uncharacterized protein LOC6649035 [Drosophila willistoni]|uniref:uncharacterized protein LOC6649035 n=1 Tax=Drosophila willistoni TaxID=7260 RepID=UPI000C26C70D|nr:uncharacterized protein LOC6649035 [Drosophila willistoni]